MKIRAGHAHPAIPIRPKVIRTDASGLVFSGSTARRMMNRKIHGSERQSVVNPESAGPAADTTSAIRIETTAAAGASRIETRVA